MMGSVGSPPPAYKTAACVFILDLASPQVGRRRSEDFVELNYCAPVTAPTQGAGEDPDPGRRRTRLIFPTPAVSRTQGTRFKQPGAGRNEDKVANNAFPGMIGA